MPMRSGCTRCTCQLALHEKSLLRLPSATSFDLWIREKTTAFFPIPILPTIPLSGWSAKAMAIHHPSVSRYLSRSCMCENFLSEPRDGGMHLQGGGTEERRRSKAKQALGSFPLAK
ncbi:hypothetical protein PV04_02825 [Phialophora macrospora]|uniref:Uncharacterized protein n=1 Tax=Phialophora macrospora TaxID=1851006 RepID=A0A0D2E8G6_9EURO|nr:hypothetical protein PV04_02825 [Phialophora macrospora]